MNRKISMPIALALIIISAIIGGGAVLALLRQLQGIIVEISVVVPTPKPVVTVQNSPAESPIDETVKCLSSGGTVVLIDCYCSDVKDFPNFCATGSCSCEPGHGIKYKVKTCDCGPNKCFNGEKCTTLF